MCRLATLPLALFLSFHVACAARTPIEAPATAESPIPDSQKAPLYLLQPGDQLSIRFWDTPELDEDVVIRPDGRISLPFIDEVMAAGSTPTELDETLTRLYRSELKRPLVTVIVRQASGQRIFVGGEVGRQGALALDGRLTLFQAVQEAGGFRSTARRRQVLLIRHQDGQRLARAIDLRPVLSGADPSLDVELQPYDIVFVPRTKITNVGLFVNQYINSLLPNNALFAIPFVNSLDNDDNN